MNLLHLFILMGKTEPATHRKTVRPRTLALNLMDHPLELGELSSCRKKALNPGNRIQMNALHTPLHLGESDLKKKLQCTYTRYVQVRLSPSNQNNAIRLLPNCLSGQGFLS